MASDEHNIDGKPDPLTVGCVMSDDELLDVADVARMYKVDRRTITNWLNAGRIPQPVKRRTNYTRWLKSQILEDIRKVEIEEKAEAGR